MRRVASFTFVTLNGCFEAPGGDISWNSHSDEENDYAKEGSQSGSILLFGRKTYELMIRYWPTPLALQQNPVVADGMNRAEKIVFSRTLQKAEWNNARIMGDDIVAQIARMKNEPGQPMTILGSGSIVNQFAERGLIDEFQFLINPIVIGDGTPLFKNLKRRLSLKLTKSRVFKSGALLLCYEPA